LGQIQLAKFANPAGLQAIGRNLFVQTSASGSPVMGNPGDSGSALGTLAQGVVESSNVNVVEEMLEMIVSQRSFELNSKVISTADQILQASTSLR